MARPIIALLTDFGLHDHYVGVMKGVVLGICPDAQVVDLTHDVPPQDIVAGTRTLDASYRFFPAGTIFLCVVDPGVGSTRRGLAIDADGWRFVGPDNGLLSRVYARAERRRAVELSSQSHALPTISRTFEGRDRFAPAAAWLACGTPIESLGPTVDSLVSVAWPEPVVLADAIVGEVVAVDHFGNLVTNIEHALLTLQSGLSTVDVGGGHIVPLVQTYGEVGVGQSCALIGSDGRLEVAIRNGHAARHFGLSVGASVQVRPLAS